MTKEQLEAMSETELKAHAKEVGVSVAGNVSTATLIDRVLAKKAEAEFQEDIAEQAEIVVPSPTAPVLKPAKANDNRQAEIMTALEEFRSTGLDLKFDDFGSVTFRRGFYSESINTSAPIEVIKNAARKVSSL